jgi:undecaprenyl-diphosphatase
MESFKAVQRSLAHRIPVHILWASLSLAYLVGLAVLAFAAHRHERFPWDLPVLLRFQAADTDAWVNTMKGVSWAGEAYVLGPTLAGVAALLWWKKSRAEAVALMLAFGGGHLLNLLVKGVVERPRPSPELVSVLESADHSSFPSGHVTSVTAALGLAFYLVSTQVRHRGLRTALQGLVALLVLVMGPSRITLGVHWPSDVLGGYLLGALVLATVLFIYTRKPSLRIPRRSV